MSNPIYALCIGVSDYRAFDPSGRLDLPGPNRDVGRWHRILHTRFQVPDEQIRQLAGKDHAADTDRAAIVDGLQWLGRSMARNADSSGLLTFSGHGLTLAEGGDEVAEEGSTLALAPSDITPSLEQAISFVDIEKIIFEALGGELYGADWGPTSDQRETVDARLENISAVIDACYRRPDVSVGVLRSLTAHGVVPSLPHPPPRIFARLSLACQLWETAYEIQTAGNWHGAFSYALTTMLEQWATRGDEQTAVTYSQASYGDLVFRARSLVNTLGLDDQNPALVGTVHNLPLLPFLRPGAALEQGWTKVQPNGVRKGEEFSPDNTDGIAVGTAVVVEIQGAFQGVWHTMGVVVAASDGGSVTNGSTTVTWDQDEEWMFFPTGASGLNFCTGFAQWRMVVSKLGSWSDCSASGPPVGQAVYEAVTYGQSWSTSQSSPGAWTALSSTLPPTGGLSTHTSQVLVGNSSGQPGPPNIGFQAVWTNHLDEEDQPTYVTKVDSFTLLSSVSPSGNLLQILNPGDTSVTIPLVSNPALFPWYKKTDSF